jgi:hypothetical protein
MRYSQLDPAHFFCPPISPLRSGLPEKPVTLVEQASKSDPSIKKHKKAKMVRLLNIVPPFTYYFGWHGGAD